MRLGMFMMPVHPPDRPMWSMLDTEKSLLADQLGYDELWLGEHFSASTEPFPSPMMFFANLVHRTKHIKFGTAVINIPNHHPAIVAAECAQFDHMAKGRFLMGVDRRSGVRLRAVQEPRSQRAQPHGNRSGRHDRKDMVARPALRSQGRILEHFAEEGIDAKLGIGYCRSPISSRGRSCSSRLSPFSSSAKTAAQKTGA